MEKIKEEKYLDNIQELLGLAKTFNTFNMTKIEFAEFEHFVYKAMEKQIAEDSEVFCEEFVGYDDGGIDYAYCPVCRKYLCDYEEYCPDCGQKVNWIWRKD